jgi:hypothetical protein
MRHQGWITNVGMVCDIAKYFLAGWLNFVPNAVPYFRSGFSSARCAGLLLLQQHF